jgi:DNA-binding response OmpR family regulator
VSDTLSSGACVLVWVHREAFLCQLRDFLEGLGCVVVEAATGPEVLSVLAKPGFEADLLVADASSRDAAALARQAVQCRPALKVLMISSEPEYINRALVPEASIAFIEKPFAWCELRRAVEALLSLRMGPGQCGFRPVVATAG